MQKNAPSSPPVATIAPLRRIVVKLGTGVLTSGVGQLNEQRIGAICTQIAGLRRRGTEVIVVTSGAIGLGMGRLGLAKRPKEVTKKQACAAIGQSLLMQMWQRGFDPHGLIAAQVLLIHDDLRVRSRYLAARQTFARLFDYGAVPVVNENDTVSAAEIMIKFGENDTLSALVASLVQAQYLVILSVAPGLIDLKGTGQVVPVVEKITSEIEAMAGGTSSDQVRLRRFHRQRHGARHSRQALQRAVPRYLLRAERSAHGVAEALACLFPAAHRNHYRERRCGPRPARRRQEPAGGGRHGRERRVCGQ